MFSVTGCVENGEIKLRKKTDEKILQNYQLPSRYDPEFWGGHVGLLFEISVRGQPDNVQWQQNIIRVNDMSEKINASSISKPTLVTPKYMLIVNVVSV